MGEAVSLLIDGKSTPHLYDGQVRGVIFTQLLRIGGASPSVERLPFPQGCFAILGDAPGDKQPGGTLSLPPPMAWLPKKEARLVEDLVPGEGVLQE